MTATLPDRPAGRSVSSAWLVGLALSLTSEGCDDEVALKHLLEDAGADRRAVEGAYGRAVALVAEYPEDAALRDTLALLNRALRHILRDGATRL